MPPRTPEHADTQHAVRVPARFGVTPQGGSFDDPLACDCGMVSSAIRKDVKMTLVNFTAAGDPQDIHSEAFGPARVQIEDAIDAALVSEAGFMGCTVRQIKSASLPEVCIGRSSSGLFSIVNIEKISYELMIL